MKNPIKIGLFLLALQGCGSNQGELRVVENRFFSEQKPLGMILVHRGSFQMGREQDDITNNNSANKAKQVSVESFWMDQTEVTNLMYREFTRHVTDSVFRSNMEQDQEKMPYLQKDSRGNWKKSLNKAQQKEFNEFFYIPNPTYPTLKRTRTDRIIYAYSWYDERTANLREYRIDPMERISYNDFATSRRNSIFYEKDFYYLEKGEGADSSDWKIERKTGVVEVKKLEDFVTTKLIKIYPDTSVWANDFKKSNTGFLCTQYFSNRAFSNYPVVGINWDQANAFCIWRTNKLLLANSTKGQLSAHYRLPTEAEWEFAARSRSHAATYPWMNDSTSYYRNKNAEKKDIKSFRANFKIADGDFVQDEFIYMAPVGSFPPNELGLFDIVGNAAEWTSSAYFEAGNTLSVSLDPNVELNTLQRDPDFMKRKVIKGGSFKDIKDIIGIEPRPFEYQFNSRAYLGFRCVRSKVGY